jgi:hypothetical protein
MPLPLTQDEVNLEVKLGAKKELDFWLNELLERWRASKGTEKDGLERKYWATWREIQTVDRDIEVLRSRIGR